jgi:hypothetical protein
VNTGSGTCVSLLKKNLSFHHMSRGLDVGRWKY